MIAFINSSKTMDFHDEIPQVNFSKPLFENEADKLASLITDLGFEKNQEIMKVNEKLAHLNFQRYLDFHVTDEKRQAIFAYKGDVYTGLKVELLNKEDLNFGQNHIRIISGLYGILRPLDEIKPYRMEMGFKLINNKKLDLYWRDILKDELKKELDRNENTLINLASKEYSSAILFAKDYSNWIDIEFLDYSKGSYKFITIYGKKARGMMAGYIMKNKINNPEELKNFDYDGYFFSDEMSTKDKYVFLRNLII